MPEYVLSGEKENIITKFSKQNWIRILSKNILETQMEYNFKIRIIKSKSKQIMVGIAQINPEIIRNEFLYSMKSLQNINSFWRKRSLMFHLFKKIDKFDLITNYGWYYSINSSSLFSDSPQNYRGYGINYNNNQDEIKLNINMKNGTFNLVINEDNKVQLYNNIPLNKPLSLSVLLYDEEDSIEIIPL